MHLAMKQLLFALSVLVLISGCAQKVQIKALQPAEIARSSQTKTIAISNFNNDTANLSGKIEAKIAQHTFDGKPYFTTVNRRDFDQILSEQKIQNSGLVDPSAVVEVGKILGAQAIISGTLSQPTSSDTFFYETRTRCKKEQCWEEKIGCTKRVVGLVAELGMTDTQKGDIIYAQSINKSDEWKHCSDDSQVIPSVNMAAQSLADRIGDAFVYKLLPHYVYYNVELLEDPDLDYTDAQEDLLENALLYIKQNRYDKAESLLSRLIESTDEKSYVPIYNIAVIKEAQGQYQEAKELYNKADQLTIKPVVQINHAITHIDTVIEQNNQALGQIKKL